MNLKKIESKNNETLKWIKKLQTKSKFRRLEGLYIVEGYKQVRELQEERIHTIIVSEQSDVQEFKHFEKVNIILVNKTIFQDISTDTTPQGILAVVHMKNSDFFNTILQKEGLYLALENIQDPGNMGTMIRLCDAVGAKGVIINGSSVDIYNPKVVKSTMGSLEHLPIYIVDDLVEAMKSLKQQNIQIYGAYLDDSTYHYAHSYTQGTCFVVGNEGNGLTDEILQVLDYRVKIPMPGKAESLNASIAASVLLYEAHRQLVIEE